MTWSRRLKDVLNGIRRQHLPGPFSNLPLRPKPIADWTRIAIDLDTIDDAGSFARLECRRGANAVALKELKPGPAALPKRLENERLAVEEP